MASKKAQQKLTRIFLFLFLINFLRAPSSATSPPDIKKNFPLPLKNFEKYYVSEWERAEQRKKIYLKKFELNAAWMYCKILAWEKSTQNERRLQRQLDHVQNPECFVFEKIIIILFKNFPHFFLEKILPVFQYWFWHYETLLWIILENFSLWKIFAKKKNGKNIWGEKFIISNQSFLFSKFSIQCQPLFPPFGCARFWTKKSQDKSVTFFYFLLSVLLIPLLKFGMWLFQFPPHF